MVHIFSRNKMGVNMGGKKTYKGRLSINPQLPIFSPQYPILCVEFIHTKTINTLNKTLFFSIQPLSPSTRDSR